MDSYSTEHHGTLPVWPWLRSNQSTRSPAHPREDPGRPGGNKEPGQGSGPQQLPRTPAWCPPARGARRLPGRPCRYCGGKALAGWRNSCWEHMAQQSKQTQQWWRHVLAAPSTAAILFIAQLKWEERAPTDVECVGKGLGTGAAGTSPAAGSYIPPAPYSLAHTGPRHPSSSHAPKESLTGVGSTGLRTHSQTVPIPGGGDSAVHTAQPSSTRHAQSQGCCPRAG